MSTQVNPAVQKIADGLITSLGDKFVLRSDAKVTADAATAAFTSQIEKLKTDLLNEIAEAKKAPAFHSSTRNWTVRSRVTNKEKEMEYSLGKILWVLNGARAGNLPSDAKYAAEVDFVKRAISDGTSSAGGSLIPQEWTDFVIPELGARTVVLKAGPNVIPMQHQIMNIPGITINQTVAMVGENAAITESDPTTNNTPLTLHAAKSLTGLSLEWLRDATPETDAALQASLARGVARYVDGQMLNGPGGGNNALGLSQIAFPTGNQIFAAGGAANGATPVYDDFNALVAALDEANAPQEKRCWFMRPGALGAIRGIKDSLGRPLFYDNLQQGALLIASGAITDLSTGPDGFILGYPVYTTTNVPNNLTRGSNNTTSYILLAAMSDVYVGQGIRSQGMEIAISDQALFTNAEIAVRIIWRFDIQPGHTASVGEIGGVEIV